MTIAKVDVQKLEKSQTGDSPMPGVGAIIRQKEPVNVEFPFDRPDSYLTPNDLFYIRSHFKAPELNADSYRLCIGGAVEKPLSFDLQQLRNLPAETCTATIECAGNGRVFLVPQVEGAQWQLGAVGNAEWTGVPLRVLLAQAGVGSKACEVIFEGTDYGVPKEKPVPPGEIAYARSLPLEKAIKPEVLVAYQMNGRALPRDHGHPVRLIVPGYYGMASVKWLTSIQLVEESFHGYWQTSDYACWIYVNEKPVRRPLAEIRLKSQIARPSVNEVIPAGSDYTVTGAAWCGTADVAGIEVSTDGGQHWSSAEFLDYAQPYAWRRWQFLWRVPEKPGELTLMARATDANGAAQPEKHDPNHGTYIINYPLPIDVVVR